MTERFTLAANVLLSRRLKNLLRIDENVEIDMSYITCAEYQLFIDEKLKADEHRQPDHWTSYRFPHGDAKKSITGVRASDAEEFCKWLTQQQSVPIFKYRLPTLAEVQEYPVTEKQVGYWCFDGEQRIIAGIVGIETGQKQTWQQNLAEVLDLYRVLYGVLYRVFDRDLNHDHYRDLYRDLDHDLQGCFLYRVLYRDLDLDLELDCVLYRDLDRDLDLELDYRDRVLYRDYRDYRDYRNRDLYRHIYHQLYHHHDHHHDHDLERVLDLVLDRVLDRDLDRVLDRDLHRDLERVLDRDIEGKIKEIEAGKASNFLLLYFPLLPVIIIYHFLSVTYEVISTNKAALNIIKLSRQESEAISRQYLESLNKIYPLYVYLVLLDERQAGRMPAWESIRIVRERVE